MAAFPNWLRVKPEWMRIQGAQRASCQPWNQLYPITVLNSCYSSHPFGLGSHETSNVFKVGHTQLRVGFVHGERCVKAY